MSEINFKINLTYGGDSFMQDEGNNKDAFFIQFLLWSIFLPITVLAGLIGNILTIIVLWRREMQSPTIYYLRALVISDSGILITSVIALTPFACSNYLESSAMTVYKEAVYPILHTPVNFIMMFLQTANVWITVSVSVERYIAICHPFKATKICTKKKALIVIIAILFSSVAYNIPRLFATRARKCPEVTGRSCFILADTPFGKTSSYRDVYGKIMFCIIIYVIPLGSLLVLNVFIIMELMRMQRRARGANIHDDNEANLSLVLVLIVVVFLVCQTPGLIAQFDWFDINTFFKWLAFSNFFFVFNSAVNFLIYTAFGRKFRKVLVRVFHRIAKHSRSFSISRSHVTANGYELTAIGDTDNTTVVDMYYGDKKPDSNAV
ncbi:FMRFamide receptor-like [Gigantopelta aegis]|uniref:FMRFamide receptor-like n=1 Tax=Gigantopelta aegis TaxID=1735272 RepID=UPI001B88E2D0|nr:FMRFamide receptor-like [Gigantopelta aegis]XP_041362518.1 FMRFamide receptor-like [Gigantopelta aegis]XP_041362519.1 FMRFamide receptor-like [Gigantopelta aegis]XP_041362520.1 FMRFamide receptor-like [Gigantopelta aegis]XP_041362521.1 FMRFamide receptor-like [Gigantopelta aegis]